MISFTYSSSDHGFGNIIQVDSNKRKLGNKVVLGNNNVLNKIKPSEDIGSVGHLDVFLYRHAVLVKAILLFGGHRLTETPWTWPKMIKSAIVN